MSVRKGRFGLPGWEIGLCLLLMALTGGVLWSRAETVLERAESVAVATTLMHIRSGLRLEQIRRLVAGQDAHGLVGSNPLVLLEAVPEFQQVPVSGRWHFDALSGELRYRPRRQAHLHVQTADGAVLLAWRILSSPQGGVEMVVTTPYQWF
ncbi:MAG: hypothetical protein CGU29_16665 [Candidatus Dactylopiibacterium carminicum]|uniref:Type II secretion system protein n=1 Tax=Candidatus Dactylopiibacterium carminicum TaxID=857335 RepID=A0A272EMT5_9RHOO|nr:hypothetical protein [Candidatus Dactylopiibacterium carminicum]PAS91402.1 MAG: hypothetical protein CGU29_16665 [Candidatus Dactylopiibacterium carminicum]